MDTSEAQGRYLHPPAPSERDRVETWRLTRLLDAGYPVSLASALAVSTSVDLHAAVGLIERGCAPAIAARILL